jgi:urease accessory protein
MLSLVRLLQLASPTLPIGAFSYSQGLERVVEDGVVRDFATAKDWLADLLELVLAPGDAALAWQMLVAATAADLPALVGSNAWFRASRESAELRAETEQMGASLLRLLGDLGLADAFAEQAGAAMRPVALPGAWALAARAYRIDPADALCAYVWSWLENAVLAAMKSIPLGQVAGQRLLLELGERIPAALDVARTQPIDAIASFAPGLAIASARHETQYTRLFRS